MKTMLLGLDCFERLAVEHSQPFRRDVRRYRDTDFLKIGTLKLKRGQSLL
jgi:hypothetical protein